VVGFFFLVLFFIRFIYFLSVLVSFNVVTYWVLFPPLVSGGNLPTNLPPALSFNEFLGLLDVF